MLHKILQKGQFVLLVLLLINLIIGGINLSLIPTAIQVQAANTSNLTSPMATNLAGVSDFSTQFPFLNFVKQARDWVRQCMTCSYGNGPAIEAFALNADGYPTIIPDGAYIDMIVIEQEDNVIPDDRYVVTWDGTGSLDVTLTTYTNRSDSDHRIEIDNGGRLWLRITATNSSDSIRNIKVFRKSQESYINQGKIFNPDFLDKIKHFKTLRFMDWLATNNSPIVDISDRITPGNYSYSYGYRNGKIVNGVPWEIVVALGNEMDADIWVNVPHLSTPAYQEAFATYVKNNLNPNLKVYVEFSNEVWNWGFGQAQDANIKAVARWGCECELC
jgi:hypothetical protein